MTDVNGEPESTPRGNRLVGLALLGGLTVLLLATAGWGWSAHRRFAEAEAAVAAATTERDAAVRTAEARQGELTKAQEAGASATTRIAELEQQVQALDGLLAGANADVARLRAELAASEPTPAPAEAAAQPLAAVEPAAAPPAAPEPERLSITFDVNSSYLPEALSGQLRALAEKLAPDESYQVRLVGSVGTGDVAGKSAEEAQRYNRWIAERRVERVADYLQRTAKAGELTIARAFATDDPSRRVVVEVTPTAD